MAATDDCNPVQTSPKALEARPAAPAQPHGWAEQASDTGAALARLLLGAPGAGCFPGPDAPAPHSTQDTSHAPLAQALHGDDPWEGAKGGPAAKAACSVLGGSVTFSGTAREFICFTLANDAFSCPPDRAMAARKIPFSAGRAPSPSAVCAAVPGAASEGAPTNG